MGNIVQPIRVGPVNVPTSTPSQPPIRVLTCPTDFVTENGVCRVACGRDYTFSGSSCRHNQEQSITYVPLRAQPDNPSDISRARSTTAVALQKADVQLENLRLVRENQASRRAEVTTSSAAAGSLAAGATLVNNQNQQFNRSTRLIENTKNSLRIRRPPVQPETEIPKEQRRIQQIVHKNALFIQIVLFLVFASAVAYLVLPSETANYVALAILSVGLIYRIFFVE